MLTRHDPRFRSTVTVDGMSYTSPNLFSQRKPAEQDAARIALLSLQEHREDDEPPVVHENITFSKAILHDYAGKLNLEKPEYNIVQLEGPHPLHFVSSVRFNGTHYTGTTAKNKKTAEQLAAYHAIVTMLDGCTSGLLYETMKAKYRLPGAIKPIEPLGIGATNSISAAMTSRENTYVSLSHKNKEAAVVVAAHVPSQVPENMSPVQTTVAEIPQLNLLPSQEQSTATSGSWELSTGDGSSVMKSKIDKI
ncbi:hypothetical protein PHAVU_001G231400 [Phaseolus vulgaris]|uniref:DRBM domain-containing protein n=1 Tax=Phaseolus vulgaris TaxID=3885 RepID=V7D2E0_PHAVU|nr:hypothetical protein PHAVU_001G231400g [Phaseolus vulgaris]ESW35391.1 hypothetical protein PHAVU_001G231400g [Phaseolus vulgaris]